MTENKTPFLYVHLNDLDEKTQFVIGLEAMGENQENSISLCCDAHDGKKGYEIVFSVPDSVFGLLRMYSQLLNKGSFSAQQGLGEEDCKKCPLYTKGENNTDSEQAFTRLVHEFISIVLIDVMTEYYRRGEPVPWQIKETYLDMVRLSGRCEPLETQTPIF